MPTTSLTTIPQCDGTLPACRAPSSEQGPLQGLAIVSSSPPSPMTCVPELVPALGARPYHRPDHMPTYASVRLEPCITLVLLCSH